MSRTKWISIAVAASLAAAVAWYLVSPSYTLMQMRDAAKANDADKLSSYIDYESLREDLKSELTARMMIEAQKDKSGFGAIGVALGSAVIGPVVDGMVSPAGVRAMLLSRQRQRGAANRAPAAALNVDDGLVIERRGFSEFVVKSKAETGGAMIFTRHGFGWKMSGVELPPP